MKENTTLKDNGCQSCRRETGCQKRHTYRCDKENCGYVGNSRLHFINHNKATHEQKKDLKCGHCSYETCDASNLKRHIKGKHDKILPFRCNMCTPKYATHIKRYLRRHKEMAKHKETVMVAQMKQQIQIQESQIKQGTYMVTAKGHLIPVVQAQPQNVQIQVQQQQGQNQHVQIHIPEVQEVQLPVAHINVPTQNVATQNVTSQNVTSQNVATQNVPAQNVANDNLANHNVDNQLYITVGQSQTQVAQGSPVDSAVASSFCDIESATNFEDLFNIMARETQNTQDDVQQPNQEELQSEDTIEQ